MIIWRTNDTEQIKQSRADLYADKSIRKEENEMDDSIQKKNEYIQKAIQMDIESIQKGIQRVLSERDLSITEIQMSVLLYIAKHPLATRKDYVKDTEGATEGGTISATGRLQELRLMKRQGGKKNGYWVIAFE